MTKYVRDLPKLEDGTYLIDMYGNIANWGERWAFGYVVALVPAFPDDQIPTYKKFGVWTDTESGKVYVDFVEHVIGREDAIKRAREREEIAIWDLFNEREIRV